MKPEDHMGLRSSIIPLLALVLAAAPSQAREIPTTCGTERGNWKEELFLHRRSMAARQKAGLARQTAGPVGRDYGSIAVMYDSGGVVARRNPFNLQGKGIRFTPAAAGYRFRTTDAVYDADAASAGSLLSGMGDDDTRLIRLPFRFPFFGASYSDLYLNSDGNISFTEGDANPVTKTIGLLTGGPPRIAPLFVDLDPTRARGGIRVLAEASRFVVSWVEVPEYRSVGTGPLQTVQLRLFPDGGIEFAYVTVSVGNAVVGISPGRAIGSTEVLSFLEAQEGQFPATITERFTSAESIDTVLLSQRFYQTHDDAYDYLAVYNTMGIPARPFAAATELTVRSTWRAGFGDIPVDIGAQFGSARRLQAFLNMGPLSQYPRDPTALVPVRASEGDTPLTVLGHEVGHLFLALASIRDASDPDARPMLGQGLAHWSFNFNSDASLLEGNRIRDNGPGVTRFTTTATVEGYSALDQYLMGFRPPEEVPPTFLVRGSGISNDLTPRVGVNFNGNRQEIFVEDIIAAEGRRSPDNTLAQRRFRMALILLVREGSEPNPDDVTQLETLRRRFEAFFAQAASGRAKMETALARNLQLSLSPAAGLVEGATVEATVTLDRSAAADLTVRLTAEGGRVSIPPGVMIRAGSRQASLQVRGVRAGVDEIVATPGNEDYIIDTARVQVSPSLTHLRLDVVAGDKQVAIANSPLPRLVEVRATDLNLIPFPGVAVRAEVSAPGVVEPARAVTDSDGIARFRWIPGGAAANQLRAAIEGTSQAVIATALGRPAFQPSGVLNAASLATGISPGAQAIVFGASLAGGAEARSPSVPWQSRLSGVQLTINGLLAPLHSVTDGRIYFYVPRELTPGVAEFALTTPLGVSDPVRINVVAFAPGLFFNTETGEAAALVAGTGLLTSRRPIRPGEYLEIYATGLGAQETTPKVWLGAIEAQVSFSGQSALFPGVHQINARIPDGIAPGVIKLRIEIGGLSSNEADIHTER
jgi:uncharacterized protein (TIGR03437 family)